MKAELILDVDFNAELRAFQSRRSRNRTAGRHLSDILHRLLGAMDPKRFGNRGPIDPALAQMGFLFEDVWSAVIAQQLGYNKQLEVERDGIFMTLDDFNAKRWRVIELKATKMSARADIRSAKFWHWHEQIKCYCDYFDTDEAELIPFFINGSYEHGGGRFGDPVVGREGHPYLMTYTKRERRDTWEMILRESDEMDREERRR